MTLLSVLATLAAWLLGAVLDANIDFGGVGWLEFRFLFPLLVMGAFIVHMLDKKKD